jgi:hypothetical protein
MGHTLKVSEFVLNHRIIKTIWRVLSILKLFEKKKFTILSQMFKSWKVENLCNLETHNSFQSLNIFYHLKRNLQGIIDVSSK